MKRLKIFFTICSFILGTGLALTSCGEENGNPAEEPIFELDNNNAVTIEAKGGSVTLTLVTNIDYSIQIPAEAKSWLSCTKTRATTIEKLTFNIAKNEAETARSAIVTLVDSKNKTLERITFSQKGNVFDKTQAIQFADEVTKTICVTNWDTNKNGELSYEEAAAVTDLEDKFTQTPIRLFTELKHFTGLKAISARAFFTCEQLVSVEIPNNVTTIGESAFRLCTSLNKITIPGNVITIDTHAFSSCVRVTDITISEGVKTIGNYAFGYCSNLKNITIPSSVTKLGKEAFIESTGEAIINCNIPDTDTNQRGGFYNSSFTKITIGEGVTLIGEYAFYSCDKATDISIANSVKTIGKNAFWGCKGLTNVTIPNGVTNLGEGAFYYCI